MKKITFLLCIAFIFGCSKKPNDVESLPTDFKTISTDLARAFTYAISVKNDTKSADMNSIESNMLNYLRNIYGDEIEKQYYENKKDITPDISNYQNLPDISYDELTETNTSAFIQKVFAATKTKLKMASLEGSNNLVQKKLDGLLSDLIASIQSFTEKCVETSSFDKNQLKNELLTRIVLYKNNANVSDLTAVEKEEFYAAVETVVNSLDSYIDLSLTYTTDSSTVPALKGGFLKKLIKDIVKAVVISVCLVGCTIGGVALGGTLCGGMPVCMITGGVAGFTGGAIAASYINNWVNGW